MTRYDVQAQQAEAYGQPCPKCAFDDFWMNPAISQRTGRFSRELDNFISEVDDFRLNPSISR
jgi:hypothetical protein